MKLNFVQILKGIMSYVPLDSDNLYTSNFDPENFLKLPTKKLKPGTTRHLKVCKSWLAEVFMSYVPMDLDNL